jgi:Tol biopolymer transport system component
MKVSVEGGAPVELAHGDVFGPAVSPDGHSVAYYAHDGEGASQRSKFVIQSIDGGAPVKEMNAPPHIAQHGWTPDGKGLAYLEHRGGKLELCLQPIIGGSPVTLLHFDSEPMSIVAFAWSHDGKKIAITRAVQHNTDVVMFSNFR